MNHIYQGRVSNVEIPNILSASTGERMNDEVLNPNPWQLLDPDPQGRPGQMAAASLGSP